MSTQKEPSEAVRASIVSIASPTAKPEKMESHVKMSQVSIIAPPDKADKARPSIYGKKPSLAPSRKSRGSILTPKTEEEEKEHVLNRMSTMLFAAPHRTDYTSVATECHPAVQDPNEIFRQRKPILLKKSLKNYFDDRIEENINEEYSDLTTKPWQYTISAEAVLARQEISCLNAKLLEARGIWAKAREGQDSRWKRATEKNVSVFSNLQEFNKYYKDLLEKRKRSEVLLALEVEQVSLKEQEIRKKEKEVQRLGEARVEIEERIEKFSISQRYLERVKDTSKGEYEDIKDLLERYNILKNARKQLTELEENLGNTRSQRKNALDKELEMKGRETGILSSYLNDLKKIEEKLLQQVVTLEDRLSKLQTNSAQRSLNLGQIKMAIFNLYQQSCRVLHRSQDKVKVDDPVGQLADIRISIMEISRLTSDIKRMLKIAQLTAREEAANRQKFLKVEQAKQEKMDKILNKKIRTNVFKVFKFSDIKDEREDELSRIFPALT